MGSGLFKLRNDLQFVFDYILFVHQINVLNMSIVKNKVVDIIVMNFTCFVDVAVTWFI